MSSHDASHTGGGVLVQFGQRLQRSPGLKTLFAFCSFGTAFGIASIAAAREGQSGQFRHPVTQGLHQTGHKELQRTGEQKKPAKLAIPISDAGAKEIKTLLGSHVEIKNDHVKGLYIEIDVSPFVLLMALPFAINFRRGSASRERLTMYYKTEKTERKIEIEMERANTEPAEVLEDACNRIMGIANESPHL